jgi:hypothetical protein
MYASMCMYVPEFWADVHDEVGLRTNFLSN